MDEKIVKDSQGLANDLVNDCISRYGVSAWLSNMGYSKLADVVMDKDRFPPAQPERKRRKWIRQDNKGKPLYGWYQCSECGAVIGGKANFCSECGADMREVDE